MKGVGIEAAFVENDFVSLGFFDCFKGFGAGVPFDLVWIVYSYRHGSWLFQRFGDFVDGVCSEKVKVQWVFSGPVEDESAYLKFHYSFLGFVALILSTSGSKLDDVTSGFQFASEFAEIITRRWQIN